MPETETSASPISSQPVRAPREAFRFAGATFGTLLRAVQIVFAKKTVSRKQPPVLRDLAAYRSADFVYDTTSLEGVRRLIDRVPANAQGMRWIHQPDAVLFYLEHDLNAPYDEFVGWARCSETFWAFARRWCPKTRMDGRF